MDLIFWTEIFVFVLLLGFSAFFSSSETSLFSLTSRQLAQMRRDDNPRVGLIERMLNEPRRLIITILIGNELVNVSASVISAAVVIQLLGAGNKWVNLCIMVPILLLFGEITPKTLAIRHNVRFATLQSRPIQWFAWLITPVRLVVRRIADWCITALVGRERSRGNIMTEDMLRTLADEAVDEGALDDLEARYIGKIFEFGDMTVEDVMTPRAGICYFPVEMPFEEMLAELRRTRHTKVPIYETTRDNVVGILYARDLLGVDLETLNTPEALQAVLRVPYFVPETKELAELFHAFRQQKLSLALTVDEYGGVTGLVAMEDLLECIFGEIHSHSEGQQQFPLEKEPGLGHRVQGAMPVAQLNARAGIALDEDRAETVGGLLLHEYGELPPEGTEILVSGARFRVTTVNNNRIEDVLLEAGGPEMADAATSTVDGPGED